MYSRWFNLPQFLKENENKDINKQTKKELKKGGGNKGRDSREGYTGRRNNQYNLVPRVFVPLDQRSEYESSGSNHFEMVANIEGKNRENSNAHPHGVTTPTNKA